MSQKKVGQVSASAVFFGAILLFSMSANLFSKSNVTNNGLKPAAIHGQVLSADGTMPPPIRPSKPTTQAS